MQKNEENLCSNFVLKLISPWHFQNQGIFSEPDLSLDQTDNNHAAWKSTTVDLDSEDIGIITDNIKIFYLVECYCRGNCSHRFSRVFQSMPYRE